MLNFKEFLQQEQLTVGKHNDGAATQTAFSRATASIVPSDVSGSETFEPHTPHLGWQDVIIQDLPRESIVGKVVEIKFLTNGRCQISIWTEKGIKDYRVDYEELKRKVPGFGDTDDIVRNKRKIKLVTQGHDSKGNPHVRWGTIE